MNNSKRQQLQNAIMLLKVAVMKVPSMDSVMVRQCWGNNKDLSISLACVVPSIWVAAQVQDLGDTGWHLYHLASLHLRLQLTNLFMKLTRFRCFHSHILQIQWGL